MKHIPLLLLSLVFFALVSYPAAAQCAGSSHGQFETLPSCVSASTGACACQPIGPAQAAAAKLAEEPQLQSIPKSGTHGKPPTASQLAMHPWITDATLADGVSVSSKAMGYTLRTTQQFLQTKYWINTRGEANTSPGSGDESGYVRFELIPKAEGGGDELRITYETTGTEEKLLLFPTKWLLLKTDPRLGDEEELGRGELKPKPENPTASLQTVGLPAR